MRRIRFPGGSTYVNSVGFSADGTILMAAVDGRIVLAKVPRK